VSQIVVGLDVSPASYGALVWAANQARLTGAELRAVHSLLLPASMLASVGRMSAPTSLPGGGQTDRAAVTAEWEAAHPKLGWRLEFYNGDPGRLLVAESRHAELLVIGTREHVGWGRILSGSVSRYCLSHAGCPVVAVPPVSIPAYQSEHPLLADAWPG
jgi:nucleotide-binding universal stress UspA family protein